MEYVDSKGDFHPLSGSSVFHMWAMIVMIVIVSVSALILTVCVVLIEYLKCNYKKRRNTNHVSDDENNGLLN